MNPTLVTPLRDNDTLRLLPRRDGLVLTSREGGWVGSPRRP